MLGQLVIFRNFLFTMASKKPKFLTLKEKADLIEKLDRGISVTTLAKQYQVAKSTICAIRNKKEKIVKCVNNTFSGPGKRKTMKCSELPIMEKKLYNWFLRQREKNFQVSGDMLKQKAKFLHAKINENQGQFHASDGWLQRFKTRFGVRFIKITGEKLSSQPELVEPFKRKLKNKMEELNLCEDMDSDSDIVLIEESTVKIPPKDAVVIFNSAIEWAEANLVSSNELMVLRNLREKALFKSLEAAKHQNTVTEFFSKQ